MLTSLSLLAALHQSVLTGSAKTLHEQGMRSSHASKAAEMSLEARPMKDAYSFFTIWKATPEPKQWIVSLPGRQGFATDDAAIWHRHLKDRKVGLISVQWWLGSGNSPRDYLRPEQIYREVDLLLESLKVKPGSVMFHGFSRGSANSYPIVALDHGRGKGYFSLCVASSGGVGEDYPPTAGIDRGDYGKDPLKGTKWVTCAGGKDSAPDRDGFVGMRKAAEWLRKRGAEVVMSIEDETTGHGALVLNPKNAAKVLDLFLKD